MFRSPAARYALRIGVMAALAGLAALKSNINDGLTASETVEVLYLTLGAGAAYAGLGAAVPAIEPFIGNKKEDAQVPVPPADPV